MIPEGKKHKGGRNDNPSGDFVSRPPRPSGYAGSVGMTNSEAIRRQYLQKAHDRGGDWQMAMLMMAEQILLLNDALACAHLGPVSGHHSTQVKV